MFHGQLLTFPIKSCRNGALVAQTLGKRASWNSPQVREGVDVDAGQGQGREGAQQDQPEVPGGGRQPGAAGLHVGEELVQPVDPRD